MKCTFLLSSSSRLKSQPFLREMPQYTMAVVTNSGHGYGSRLVRLLIFSEALYTYPGKFRIQPPFHVMPSNREMGRRRIGGRGGREEVGMVLLKWVE